VIPVATVANGAQQLTMAGVWIAAIGIVGLLIRQIMPWRRQVSADEQTLRADLLRRVERLEQTLDRERLRHNAERALDRHRLNNITQCFDAMLMLIETTPERASEIVTKIKEMRAVQMKAEAQEKAIIRAAEIEADEREADHDGN
jgi:uncharacterized membrane protein YccC